MPPRRKSNAFGTNVALLIFKFKCKVNVSVNHFTICIFNTTTKTLFVMRILFFNEKKRKKKNRMRVCTWIIHESTGRQSSYIHVRRWPVDDVRVNNLDENLSLYQTTQLLMTFKNIWWRGRKPIRNEKLSNQPTIKGCVSKKI